MTTSDKFEPAVAGVLVREIVRQAKSAEGVNLSLARALMKYPLYDSLAKGLKGVSKKDYSAIFQLAESTDQTYRDLAAAIMRGFKSRRRDIHKYWFHEWQKKGNSFDRRVRELFLAADNPNLAQVHKDEMFLYIIEHGPQWTKFMKNWYGTGLGEVLKAVQKRLDDRDFPKSKDWLYLCVAACDEPVAATKFLRKFRNSPDKFERQVVKFLLKSKLNW